VERPILDYPLHRFRLIPHLAKAFALSQAGWTVTRHFSDIRTLIDEDPECDEGTEFHAILSAFKAISSWWGTKAI